MFIKLLRLTYRYHVCVWIFEAFMPIAKYIEQHWVLISSQAVTSKPRGRCSFDFCVIFISSIPVQSFAIAIQKRWFSSAKLFRILFWIWPDKLIIPMAIGSGTPDYWIQNTMFIGYSFVDLLICCKQCPWFTWLQWRLTGQNSDEN